MHERALHLIETIGVKIPHVEIIDITSSYNGVRIEGDSVRFSSEL